MAKKHAVSNDNRMNSSLQGEVQGLRGGMVAQAEKNELPERFQVTPHADYPRMIIEDTVTGKKTEVGLYAYGDVRRVLGELFGE